MELLNADRTHILLELYAIARVDIDTLTLKQFDFTRTTHSKFDFEYLAASGYLLMVYNVFDPNYNINNVKPDITLSKKCVDYVETLIACLTPEKIDEFRKLISRNSAMSFI